MPARIRSSQFFLVISFALLAVLAGCSGNSGGGTTSRAPAPVVTSVSPSSVSAGSPAFMLSVTGNNFQPQAVVSWNASALTTTYTSTSTLSAAVPANLAATGVIGNITVTNPDSQTSTGGATSQQISVLNPRLRSLLSALNYSSPAQRTRPSPAQTSIHPPW
jgi:hypothetical protein